ncbi:hypothetical protein LguiA_023209 [Lonicera macranthoides]
MGAFSFAIVFLLSTLFSISKFSNATDTITAAQSITDGDTIVSSDGSFEMGFFSPGNSNRYLGIWYKKIPTRTVVWVANRQIPLTHNASEGVLKLLDPPGILVLLNATNSIIWSSNTSRSNAANTSVAQLLDSGNLVVKDAGTGMAEDFFHWQSFDYPGDTLLPGMKLGKDLVTGLERHISSWKSYSDAAQGEFTYGLDLNGYPQAILKKGSDEIYRLGSWNGLMYSGMLSSLPIPIYTYQFVFTKEEIYHSYVLINSSIISRVWLSPEGLIQRWVWIHRTRNWLQISTAPVDTCDNYLPCGAYGNCNINKSPACGCLDKFENKPGKGCVRKTALNCQVGDGFLKYSTIKLPDTRYSWFNQTMTTKECEIMCLRNCSCMAYANSDVRGNGSGCLLWFGDLIDIRELNERVQDIYIRVASTELGNSTATQFGSSRKRGEIIKVGLPLLIVMALLGMAFAVYLWKKKKMIFVRLIRRVGILGQGNTNETQKEDMELPLFGLSTITTATNNFSLHNKLGEGGFGPVYKGVLEGREIAVKRLSKTSMQGFDEFRNEVICIAKLQHRNLVKLLGCCIQGDEMLLIYEYMPNGSLDAFIFDESLSAILDWPKRFHIINGIARGLLYLHRDSRLRIIHRDLKASNVLLDIDMNPKISDFGLARSFEGNEMGANTNRVVGTYGYMSPEYAVDGIFSVKSDVFSFGVLVLEIVSRKRNRGFIHQDHSLNLLGHAWRLYKEGRSMELIDRAALGESSYVDDEVVRSIEVGLLCVQQCPEDRPTMSSVVLMLSSKVAIPQPKEPGFFTERNPHKSQRSASTSTPISTNEVTFSLLDGR